MDKGEQERGRRVRIYQIAHHAILSMLNARQDGYVTLPAHQGVPSDARVVAVRDNFSTQCFDLLVEHPTFDLVAPGDEPVRVPNVLQVAYYVVRMPPADQLAAA